jgi:hypothetical protein
LTGHQDKFFSRLGHAKAPGGGSPLGKASLDQVVVYLVLANKVWANNCYFLEAVDNLEVLIAKMNFHQKNAYHV